MTLAKGDIMENGRTGERFKVTDYTMFPFDPNNKRDIRHLVIYVELEYLNTQKRIE